LYELAGMIIVIAHELLFEKVLAVFFVETVDWQSLEFEVSSALVFPEYFLMDHV